MVSRGHESKNIGKCGNIAKKIRCKCEKCKGMGKCRKIVMVGRGNERKNMGKCWKIGSNGGSRTSFMEIVENTVKTKEMG